jgi:hypothetical protein
MRGGAHSNYSPDPFKQAVNRQHIAQLDDYDLRMIVDKVSAAEIDQFQLEQEPDDLLGNPLPSTVPGELRAYFTHNTTIFPDEIEALIDEDLVMQSLLELPRSEERMLAVRARRSGFFLALLVLKPGGDEATQQVA